MSKNHRQTWAILKFLDSEGEDAWKATIYDDVHLYSLALSFGKQRVFHLVPASDLCSFKQLTYFLSHGRNVMCCKMSGHVK